MPKDKQAKYEREADRAAEAYAAQFAAEMVDADIAAGKIHASQRETEIADEKPLLKRALLRDFLKDGAEKQEIRIRLQSTLSQRCGDGDLAATLVRKIDFEQLDEKQLTAVLVKIIQTPALGHGESEAHIRSAWDTFVAPYHNILLQRAAADQAQAARLRAETQQLQAETKKLQAERQAAEARVEALEAQLAAQQTAGLHFFPAASSVANSSLPAVSDASVAADKSVAADEEPPLKKARNSWGD